MRVGLTFLSLLLVGIVGGVELLVVAEAESQDAAVFRPVYGPNVDGDGVEVCFYVRTSRTDELETALNRLAATLSRFLFDGLPLWVRLEEADGEQVAVVGLEEHDAWREAWREFEDAWADGEEADVPRLPGRPSWRETYFQGSTGGAHTTMTLRMTFLQEQIDEPWIDAVRFEYEGVPISDEWDHISLSGTFHRRPR